MYRKYRSITLIFNTSLHKMSSLVTPSCSPHSALAALIKEKKKTFAKNTFQKERSLILSLPHFFLLTDEDSIRGPYPSLYRVQFPYKRLRYYTHKTMLNRLQPKVSLLISPPSLTLHHNTALSYYLQLVFLGLLLL